MPDEIPVLQPSLSLVASILNEELEARHWTIATLARHMGGDVAVNQLAVEFLLMVPDDPRARLGREMAAQLALALGTSIEFWLHLAGEGTHHGENVN